MSFLLELFTFFIFIFLYLKLLISQFVTTLPFVNSYFPFYHSNLFQMNFFKGEHFIQNLHLLFLLVNLVYFVPKEHHTCQFFSKDYIFFKFIQENFEHHFYCCLNPLLFRILFPSFFTNRHLLCYIALNLILLLPLHHLHLNHSYS